MESVALELVWSEAAFFNTEVFIWAFVLWLTHIIFLVIPKLAFSYISILIFLLLTDFSHLVLSWRTYLSHEKLSLTTKTARKILLFFKLWGFQIRFGLMMLFCVFTSVYPNCYRALNVLSIFLGSIGPRMQGLFLFIQPQTRWILQTLWSS